MTLHIPLVTRGHASLSQAQRNHRVGQRALLVGGTLLGKIYQETNTLQPWELVCSSVQSLCLDQNQREGEGRRDSKTVPVHTCT